MMFPVPDHLPRRQIPQDVSSSILEKIGQATNANLTAEIANQWIAELDQTILATKHQIHTRISSNLPEFEKQRTSALSLQERLTSLKRNVDTLDISITAPRTGLVDSVIETLTLHSKLSQDKSDLDSLCDALDYVSQCRNLYNNSSNLVETGQLSLAVQSGKDLDAVLATLPEHIARTQVVIELQRKFSISKARLEDQLDDAYCRAFDFSQSQFTISKDILVRHSEHTISFPEIVASLSPTSLSQKLVTLRRDLLNLFDHVLTHPVNILSSSSQTEETLEFNIVPSIPKDPSLRLRNLGIVLDFLALHLIPHLPSSFPPTLSRPLTTKILDHVIIPALPSSFDHLSSYLTLSTEAVNLEATYVVKLLGNDPHDTPVKEWVSNLGGHYERQKRAQILENARKSFMLPHEGESSFLATIILQQPEPEPPIQSSVIPIQDDTDGDADPSEDANDTWGFDDESSNSKGSSGSTEAWGFDEDMESKSKEEIPKDPPEVESKESEPDADEAWGWSDEEIPPDDDVWDDPWTENSPSTSSVKPSSPPSLPIPTATPKVAKRLEKLAMKAKRQDSESLDSSIAHGSISQKPPSHTVSLPQIKVLPPPLAPPKPRVVTESYLVSGRMKAIVSLLQTVLHDAAEFQQNGSRILNLTSSPLMPGTILYQSANSVLDLFRAVHPIRQSSDLLNADPKQELQFSNDCFWLNEELGKLDQDKFVEMSSRLKIVSERVFDGTIGGQSEVVQKLLADGAQGFTRTADQERYDGCEAAVNDCVQTIKRMAQQWKGTLAKSRYYAAIGLITDAALSHVLQQVLALKDIPEMESQRISELCRVFNSLEGLFVEDPEQPSFVVSYVSSWLKFSYLSELLEASMADITYLFEEGALVDFQTEELVRLVKALFADNALRTTTMNKIMAGHPIQ